MLLDSGGICIHEWRIADFLGNFEILPLEIDFLELSAKTSQTY